MVFVLGDLNLYVCVPRHGCKYATDNSDGRYVADIRN